MPIPYPNFGMDSELASGSSTVKIGGKPISQENSSNYSKISGDEAGAAPKKGVITSKNMGKAYAQMWSMDVKADGKGVVRFGDIATTNHASMPGGALHPMKGTAARELLKKNPKPTVREALDDAKQSYGDHHDKLQPPVSKEKKEEALECIEIIIVDYLLSVAKEVNEPDGTTRKPTSAEVLATKLRA